MESHCNLNTTLSSVSQTMFNHVWFIEQLNDVITGSIIQWFIDSFSSSQHFILDSVAVNLEPSLGQEYHEYGFDRLLPNLGLIYLNLLS